MIISINGSSVRRSLAQCYTGTKSSLFIKTKNLLGPGTSVAHEACERTRGLRVDPQKFNDFWGRYCLIFVLLTPSR